MSIDMVAEIAAASREQTTGLDQVNGAVAEVDQVTQSNAGQTAELSGTATSLSEKASHLRELVAAFELGEPRTAAPVATAAAVRRIGTPPLPKGSAPRLRAAGMR